MALELIVACQADSDPAFRCVQVVPKKGQLKMEAISAEEALRSCQVSSVQ